MSVAQTVVLPHSAIDSDHKRSEVLTLYMDTSHIHMDGSGQRVAQ